MNYKAYIQKFIFSQYIYAGTRIALAIVIPSIILAYFGILKEYFLFPLGTSFVGLTDSVGPFIRRRNALIFSVFTFAFVAITTTLLKDFPILVYAEIIIFGMFFTMLGIYGQRLAGVGGLTLVVFSIFIDGQLVGNNLTKSILIFIAGCLWFLAIFMIVTRLQPYKLPSQMIGENYIKLANYLKIKAKLYQKNTNIEAVYQQVIAKQVVIKELQEETREVVFKTRTLVNESTTTSRFLMLMFLNSLDFYEKLITSDQDYKKLHSGFSESEILTKIHNYLILLSEEITHIGIALQSGTKNFHKLNIDEELEVIYNDYFQLRNREMNPETLENFMALRLVLLRVNDITNDVKTIVKVFSQDLKNAKSLSTGLDLRKFVPKQEKLNFKVFLNNFSLKSNMFRHSIRLTIALLLGYGISQLSILGIGHSYWILITIIAIMRPAYSITKHRNILRIYGTAIGAITAYLILIFIENEIVLLGILLSSMILCFSLLKHKYATAVFFMTIYIFISFNFLNPGNVNLIFKDRILDTIIAGIIASSVSYFLLPVWEKSQNIDLMKVSAKDNLNYFQNVMQRFENLYSNEQESRLKRKNAIISLANLSDNFQKMLSDPKNQRKKMETIHQFVNTSHLITAYTASLAQYTTTGRKYNEIDFLNWNKKISAELSQTIILLNQEEHSTPIKEEILLQPEDLVEYLLAKRKNEIEENDFFDIRDPKRITKLTELKNIKEILELTYDVTHEQRKIIQKYFKNDN